MTTTNQWPELRLADWADTRDTLHMWTQIVGKTRLSLAPCENHWWHVPLYTTPRGLTTSPMPHGAHTFEIAFDFLDHSLLIETSDGRRRAMPLVQRSVASFYEEYTAVMRGLNLEVDIWTTPVEVADPIPFEDDTKHASYDAAAVSRWWQALAESDRVLKEFRGRFLGKSSPVHFWWGSFDLAVTRFSGRRAPEREGADMVTKEAYSHECISCGFWTGGGPVSEAAFYSYAAPAPPEFAAAAVRPGAALYSKDLSEFILMYDDVRTASSPREALLDFVQSTYEAGAQLAGWDRAALERT